jgi:ribonuclease VapC
VNSVVLDSSALLAVLLEEPGAGKVVPYLEAAALSAVNISEVAAKGVERGLMLEGIIGGLSRLRLEIVAFDTEQAYLAASMRPTTRQFGLSLGDRACLSLALSRNVPAVTADKAWEACNVGVKIIRIR